MINYQYESLFRQDSIDKQIHITGDGISLDNSLIYQGSFELNEAIDTNDDLMFGSIYSSSLKFTTSDVESSFIGKSLTVTMTVDNHSTNDFTFGTYKVTEEKWTANRTKKEIVAYDSLYDAINKDVTDWYNALTFPMTLATFRNSFFTHVGITEKTASLINDNLTLQKGINPSRLLGGEVIRAICQINGCFGKMTRDNKFEYKILSSTSVYSVTPSMYTECKFEDYTVNQIDKVIIRQEENDIGGSYGSGDNALIIQGNFLVYGLENGYETIAQNILSVVGSITYTPAEISCIGNPCVEVGDLIIVSRTNGQTFNTYVLSRKLNNIQSIKDQYTSFGNESRMNDSYLYDNEWLQLLGKTNKLTRTVDETISEVGELGNAVTTIRQDTDSLELQVQSMQEQLDGETQYYERHGEPTLLNYPYWDFTRGIPCNNTIVLDQIYNDKMQEGGSKYPHFTYYDEDLKNYMRALCIDLDTGNGYRFIQENGVWTWKQIADSDFSILYNQIAELNIEVDGIEERVSNTESTITSLGQQVSTNTTNISTTANGLTAEIQRATRVEGEINSAVSTMSTTVTATAQGLSTVVTETIPNLDSRVDATEEDIDDLDTTVNGTGGLVDTVATHTTQISQNSTNITAKVDKVYGTTSSSFSWTLTSSGFYVRNFSNDVLKITSSGAEITGKVTATSGYIGNSSNGFTIGSTYIYNGMTSLADTSHNGIYLGTDGIALGKGNFKVTSGGSLTAKTGYIGNGSNGFTIGSTAIYNGKSTLSDTSNDGIYLGTDGIALGKGKFKVTKSGELTMNSGSISLGNFSVTSAGVVSIASGSINLGSGNFIVDSNGKVTIKSGSIAIGSNDNFKVTDTGVVTIKSGSINIGSGNFVVNSSGQLTAKSGYIGNGSSGFTIGNTYIQNGVTSMSDTTHNGIYLGTDGIRLGKGNFSVTSAGALTMNSGSINLGNGTFTVNNNGAISASSGSIGLFSIESGKLNLHNSRGGSVYASIYGDDDINYGSLGALVLEGGAVNLTGGFYGVNITATDEGSVLLSNVSTINNETVGDSPKFTDEKVKQTATTSSGQYRVLLGGTNDDTETVSAYKSTSLQFNPYTGYLTGKDASSNTFILNPYYLRLINGANIDNTLTQRLTIQASTEADYGVQIAVRDSNWTFAPITDTKMRLGSPSYRWGQIYSNSATINTSDRKAKKYIKPLRKSAREFIMNLNPVSYQFKNGESGRTHYGLIAQDVEETMKDLGMTDLDFAGFCKDKVEDDYIYGLRYEEFIAPLIKTIQLQQEEIEELKRRVG